MQSKVYDAEKVYVNAKSRAFTANKVHVAKHQHHVLSKTRKPSCRWQTRATRKHAKKCSNKWFRKHVTPFTKVGQVV